MSARTRRPLGLTVLVAAGLGLCVGSARRAQGAPIIAYEVPTGMVGNQAYGGALGMDFDVQLDILLTRIGVFDSGSDGLPLPISARPFDRDSLTELGLNVLFLGTGNVPPPFEPPGLRCGTDPTGDPLD